MAMQTADYRMQGVLPQSERHPNLAEPVCVNCYSIGTPANAPIMYAQSNLQGLPVPVPEA